ncbi:hypothetical protein EDD11_004603 [Mortierella claussenii]|nr:hypothetical protein EDD11_004603 [Mortierella claussenii]
MGSSQQTDQSNDADGDTPLETDPTGRFQRLNEILGEGAYKHVYRAFDQEEGMEVAWNQLRIDHLTKKEAQKILSEIEILESIRNDHIINFYASWSTKAPNGGERVVFVTELMSSGTLKQYLKKTLKGPLKPKVLKSWCRQILQGLVYLHTHDPPIIHRDLKCDNIFINGNNGQLKIGDLGLAVVRHRTHVSSVLGTPEFMAPELYDEKYDEKVDIYAFGMCVTKEYPYSECTNQAQIYRKVTKGIKPQSLDHVQDAETREFINRCLDHDDRTRPSAQELLDSDFLKPCVIVPPLCGSSMGLFNISSKGLMDGMDTPDGSASVSFVPGSSYLSTAAPSPASLSMPLSQPVVPSRALSSPDKAVLQPFTIPSAAFTTTTTVDADNKTYHIRSNLVPQTPTSAEQSSSGQLHEQEQQSSEAETAHILQEHEDVGGVEPPTLHSHANSKTCSIQVVQYGDENGDQLNLKMICTCPVAGPRDVAMAAGTHEIKFPFDLNVDTVEEVVAEMIREQILSGDDREEATSRIQDLIENVISARKERARAARELNRVAKAPADQHYGRASPQHHGDDHANRSISTAHKNGHHRQLNVPSVYDLDQYGTSPTESQYDHYSSVGSNASATWNIHSPVESDQGYGTVPPQPPQQPPVISEATFPPLNHPQTSRSKPADVPDHTAGSLSSKQHLASYSEAVQNPVVGQHPMSPTMGGHDRSPMTSRPQSMYDLEQKASGLGLAEVRPLLTNGASNKHGLRDIEIAYSEKKKVDDSEDVGYTSPYRHGVSSSSINYHRRSPSVDTSARMTSPAPSSMPIHVSPSEPAISSPEKSQIGLDEQRLGALSSDPRPAVSRDSPPRNVSSLNLSGMIPRTVSPTQPVTLDPRPLDSASTNDFAVPSILPHIVDHDQRVPHSTDSRHHHHQFSHQHVLVPHPKPVIQSLSEPITANEAKKDVELWTNKVNGGAGYMNGSNYSSCPEMSDDEEILDEDLKILREQQRQELELMRLQHVQQWEKMMKLKEQRGQQDRTRRKSDVNGVINSPVLTPSPIQHD